MSDSDPRQTDLELDSLDRRILGEIVTDGRLPVSDLAGRLGISRTYAGIRLQRLLDTKTARIAAFTDPVALGYNTVALTGIQVSPGDLYAVAAKLRSLPEVKLVLIGVGWQDIIILTMFPNAADLSDFSVRELGGIRGIKSIETTLFTEWRGSFPYLASGQRREKTDFYSPSAGLSGHDQRRGNGAGPDEPGDRGPDRSVDRTDLRILSEMELDGRQSLSHLAKRLGISRASASARLHRLLERKTTRIVGFAYPVSVGYQIFTMMGMRVSPKEITAVMDRFDSMPNTYWLARVIGRHDVMVWMTFRGPMDLSRFLGQELAAMPGILSRDTMIGLEATKMSFAYLASSYLRAAGKRRSKIGGER